jgi:hypothetical protein
LRYGVNDHANDGIVALADDDATLTCSTSDDDKSVKLDLFSRAGVVASDAARDDDDPDALAPKKKSKKNRRHHH